MHILKEAYLECVLPEKNRRSFYRIMAVKDLFGIKLERQWGRIGTKGRTMPGQRFACMDDLMALFEEVLKIRFKHDYRIVSEKDHTQQPERTTQPQITIMPTASGNLIFAKGKLVKQQVNQTPQIGVQPPGSENHDKARPH